MQNQKFHAILPMRGGSERVIGKNVRPLRNIPLFEWMLTTLVEAKLNQEDAFTTIIVDTDDDVIEKECKEAVEKMNANDRVYVLRRDEDVIGGMVSMCLVLQARAKQCLRQKIWDVNDVVVQVHATSPFFGHRSISECLEQYRRSKDKFDSAMGVTKLQTRFWTAKGNPLNHDPDVLIRTQDLDPIYEDNSAIYVTPIPMLLSDNPLRVGQNPMLFEVDPLEATDIDTETDFVLAESLAKTVFKERMAAAALNTVLVTGAFGGIGRACVQTFLDQGWQVIGIDNTICGDDDDQVAGWGEKFYFFRCDISDPEQLDSLYSQVQDKLNLSSGLNAIVNNAAIQIIKPLDQCTSAEFDKIMAVNVRAPFLLTSKFLPQLKKANLHQASVVNISSVHAIATSPSIGLYAASKGALLAITRSMAIEFSTFGIRVNAVLPGAVDTGMLRAGLSRESNSKQSCSNVEEKLASLSAKTVLGRVGTPSEIGNVIHFLACSQSSYLTGQSIVVDGGATARLSTE